MATIGNTTSGLEQYVGATVETVNNSMFNGTTVQGEFKKLGVRGGPNITSVIIKNTQSNINNTREFVRLASIDEKRAREVELDVGYPNPITFKNINKPDIKVNMGDIAEGVFAAALAARFINRTSMMISASDVRNVISQMVSRPIMNKKSVVAENTFKAPNEKVPLQDDVILKIVLGQANMNFLLDSANANTLSGFVNASILYANRSSVKSWVDTVYTNNRYDKIEVTGDGVSGQRSTKVDVKVRITDDKGVLMPANIDVSVKAGDVKQFGQVGGIEYNNLADFFNRIFGVQADTQVVSDYENKVTVKKDVDGALFALYNGIVRKLNNITEDIKLQMGQGISYYATLDDDNVEMVQLSQGEASIYRFNNVGDALRGLPFNATISRSGTLPLITISSNTRVLLYIRSKKENKKNKQGLSYTYYRNYIEKGPLLGDLIATSAREEQ